ncbi:DUF4031 domain-containing protein [Burkholderia sp. BCCIQ04A]|uniref:DUF4031 domain-containing protein n=1 Tax=Burkholderia anthinoferrum TaxID=3090833 RepID=A0ABU5WNW3_9BURK|nr:DUF4031 domain-containing protein [Burkholderia anthinoferrum]MEB2504594.1 DUF4031 domain-containing protein [Burkholderia anthinoferrum]MEB2530263.1 DUF4031 domain-containing protein [Burkholderia anthinoferrum]MEB2561636.1 DUF4031 domain-containing protein [Burkholderia anthinoferrum]MEB2580614.1 DUF4031 domain-containing protein [Burkholderia anthinoferrum]MEB2634408.1 DUF4031 domain-containing protein [Burkholderia anthinoferrum]
MTVYVDDMYRHEIGKFGRMKMSHLIADTTDELLAMVRAIGVNPKWIQHAGTRDEHFDIAISMRAAAIAAGAIPITYRQCGAMNKRRRVTGALGSPDDAVEWLEQFVAARREARTAATNHQNTTEPQS